MYVLDVSPSKDNITHPIPAEVFTYCVVLLLLCNTNKQSIYKYTYTYTYICVYVWLYVHTYSYTQPYLHSIMFYVYFYLIASGSKRINGGQYTEPEVNVVEAKKLLWGM